MNRKERARIAAETVEITEKGAYTSPAGAVVDLRGAIEASLRGTVTYLPEGDIPETSGAHATRIEVFNETTLEGAERLAAESSEPVAVLNFASAFHPGGGFLSGAQAQEESLARASALAHLLDGHEMYAVNRELGNPLHTDHLIFTPGVPVFRDDDGRLLEQPQLVSMLTAPAVNAKRVAKEYPHRVPEIPTVMERRIHRVLGALAQQGCGYVVLGAWGCGVFGNDPTMIASLFDKALAEGFAGVFQRVRFSVLDLSVEQATYQAFKRPFRVEPSGQPA
ncbi:MAG: TIGR02452 family protein, partial [Myxococcota bacterium]